VPLTDLRDVLEQVARLVSEELTDLRWDAVKRLLAGTDDIADTWASVEFVNDYGIAAKCFLQRVLSFEEVRIRLDVPDRLKRQGRAAIRCTRA
jgi:hypothetical protein